MTAPGLSLRSGELIRAWLPLTFEAAALKTNAAEPADGTARTLKDSSEGIADWFSVTTVHCPRPLLYRTPMTGKSAIAMHGQVAPRYGFGVTNSRSPGRPSVRPDCMTAESPLMSLPAAVTSKCVTGT